MAEKALSQLDEDKGYDLVESYSDGFREWYGEYSSGKCEVSEELLLSLDTKHRAIIERVQTWQSATSSDLRDLKLKGKGILAYTDILPKRIGRMAPKKG